METHIDHAGLSGGGIAGSAPSLATYVADALVRPAPKVGARDNLVTSLLASLVILGLYLDGWRHINLADNRAAAFLTWWHVPLYIGVTLTGVWITTRRQRPSDLLRGRFDLAEVPAGYRLGVAGMALLTFGAAIDAVWHTFYGLEQGIERTMSPAHILLFAGATLILGSPLRAAWAAGGPVAPTFRGFFPALLSLTLSTAAVAFMVQFLVPFLHWTAPVPDMTAIGDAGENTRIVAVASVLMTNALLFTPLLYAMRRWRPPFGSATFLVTVVSAAELSMKNMAYGWTLGAAVVGGLVADLLISRLHVAPERAAVQRIVAGLAPVAFWVSYFAILSLVYGVRWERNIWLSSVLLAGLGGALTSALLTPAQPVVLSGTPHEAGTSPADERGVA